MALSQSKINIKALKAKLKIDDYKKVMKALDIPAYCENGESVTFFTGDKNKNAYNGSPKLILYKDTGVFLGLTSARSYDLISLTQTRLGLLGKPNSFIDAVNFITATVGLELDSVKRVSSPHVCDWSSLEKFIRFKSIGAVLPEYDKTILDQLERSYPLSWLEEGISVESMEKYQIGYYSRTQATTIPCFSEMGDLVGIRVRNWNQDDLDDGRKYVPLMLLDGTCYKFPTNAVFYGINYNKPYIEQCGTVVLVEGEKSALKADTWWGEKSNVLALYGSQLGTARRNQLVKMGVSKVILALDSDFHEIGDADYAKFEKKMFTLAKQLKGYFQVEIIYNNIGLKNAYKCSPFDFDEETFNGLYEAREIIE